MREADPPSGRVPGTRRARFLVSGETAEHLTLRPNEATVLYNAACVLGSMNKNRKPWTPFARLGTFLNSPFNSLLSLTSPLQRL